MIRKLTVLYDGECGLCARCRAWLERQPAFIPLEFTAYQDPSVAARWPGLGAWQPERELVVIDDRDGVYQEADAWLMCLYALVDYREWSLRLARPAWKPHVALLVRAVAERRLDISRWMGLDDATLGRVFGHGLERGDGGGR